MHRIRALTVGLLVATVSMAAPAGEGKAAGADPFAAHRTYAWKVAPPEPAKDPDGRALKIYEAITAEADAELQAKGFTRVEENPDLHLVYAGSADTASQGAVYTGVGAWDAVQFYRSDVQAVGSLTLMFLDPSTGTPLWQGRANVGLVPGIEKVQARARKAVRKILGGFPPK